MKNAIIALLAFALVVVGVFAYRQTTALSMQGQELRATLAAKSASDSLDLQAKCTKQAAEAIRYLRIDQSDPLLYYQSHYNRTMGKCFVQLRNSLMAGPLVTMQRKVLDAFEFREIGGYSSTMSMPRESGEPFVNCVVILPSGESKKCSSEDEFLSLIKPYMER